MGNQGGEGVRKRIEMYPPPRLKKKALDVKENINEKWGQVVRE